ncbi:lipopolysaccharide biosynthesis protein [Novosphingobium jiangmenense]|uniref:Lipopolysaccharide biosynthesis protein n=1 Tax=Novosphingobium jiangmenense TaxID=2791981 RepID=A0ABS0HFE8_9SPHN|nr:oligosaccharide flippase family protein [Novosphingobium jiangmenense]MBF9150972.1 lipopolysaccharide biosynthesis protein [Novosphingobium jiangmenense]
MTAPRQSQTVIARGAGSNALSFVIRFAARASFLYVGARLYGAANYGVFTMASAMVELAAPVASLGLKRMIFPWLEEATQGEQPRGATHVLLDALLLATLSGLVVSALLVLLAEALPGRIVSDSLRLALALIAPAVLGQVIGDIALAATRWTHKMRYEVIARGLVEPYVLTAVAFGAWYIGLEQTGMVIGYWAGSVALVLFSVWSARHCLGPLHLRRWRPHPAELLRRARALAPASGSDFLTTLAQRIDLYLVGFLLGDAAVGVYGVLRQLRTPILQVRQAFDGILTPLTARTMMTDGDVATGKATAAATRVILTIQLGVVLLMAATGEALLDLFGAHYAGGYAALLAMVLAETVNGAFGVSEMILYYRRPALALQVNLILIVIAALAIPLLTPQYGILGAAFAMLLAALVASFMRRHWLSGLGVRPHPFHAAIPLLAAGTSVLLGVWLGGLAKVSALAGAHPVVTKAVSPLIALAFYGTFVALWRKAQPGVLSLNRFRVS